MNEQNKDSRGDFDDKDTEIRKSDFDTFFDDLNNVEEEVLSEAYDLVVHALSLIEGHYYDDAIEILRQAIGLYSQINRIAEIEALNNKISEIYILKEQFFRETVSKPIAKPPPQVDEENEIYKYAKDLISKGKELLESEKFDEVLDNYDEAIMLFKDLGASDEIENVNKLIEECYNKKADYLKRRKEKAHPVQEVAKTKEAEELNEEELKRQRLKAFEEAKKREEEISNKAFEIIGKASDLAEIYQYEQSINLYLRGIKLFEEINWVDEAKKIQTTIEQIEKLKIKYEKEMEQLKFQEEKTRLLQEQASAQMMEQPQMKQNMETQIQAEKLSEMTKRKSEEESFRNIITEMIDKAEKLAREYDIEMKKVIKKGYLLEDCVYPKVIAI
ncbi:MAG: hypothetical protein ACFE9P_01225, partial [Candidatus Hermodarchaeota archaeon]